MHGNAEIWLMEWTQKSNQHIESGSYTIAKSAGKYTLFKFGKMVKTCNTLKEAKALADADG